MILLKATREASSMQTWRNSHPTPRLLLWPLRSPVMRWPIWSNLPSFDVDVDHLAGPLALVAAGRFGRLQGAQLVETQALEGAADRGGRDADHGGDLLAGQALAAQAFDALDHLRRRRLTQPMRPRAAIL
jgi:hypothetical protein